MSEAWVVNASPLILFSRIGRLDLIERLAPTILIPNAVIEEVRAGQGKDRMAAAALTWAGRYQVEDVTVVASIEHWDLGLGESQVIAHSVGGSRAVYVLQAFQKKSPSGTRTAKRDVDLVAERLKAAQRDHEEQHGKPKR